MTCTRSSRPTITPPTRRCRWPATSRPARPSTLAERFFGDLAAGPVPEPIRGDAPLAASRDLRARGSRRAAAGVSQLAFAGDVCARRCRAGCDGRRAGPRQDVAALSSRWCTSGASRPTCRRISSRARWPACSRWRARPPRASRCRNWTPPSATRSPRSAPRPDRASSWSARSPRARRNFIYRLQTIGGFGGKSDQLNAYNVYRGDPGYFDADRKRYRDVTAGGVAAAARRWLLEPPLRGAERGAARPPRAGAAGRHRGERLVSRVDRSRLPEPAADRPFRFPRIVKRTLPNGLEVRAVTHRAVPIVSMVLLVPGGSSADPPDRHGLASITAGLLDEGSRGRVGARGGRSRGAHRRRSRSRRRRRRRRRQAHDARSVSRDRPGAGARDRHRRRTWPTTTSTAFATCGSSACGR